MMSDSIDIFLLDKSNNVVDEINIKKPETFDMLKTCINNNLKNLPVYYLIFYPSSNNNEIEINNNEDYKLAKDILFIREIEEKSIFIKNYDRLSEEKKDMLDEKFNCSICSEHIKDENPFFCYICQKIFHHECLKKWNNKMELQKESLKCPICRNELPLDKWKEKLDYDDNRKEYIETMDQLNKLKTQNAKQNEIINNYRQYTQKITTLFQNLFNKINEINSLIKLKINSDYHNILKKLLSNFDIDLIEHLSTIINEEFEKIKGYINNKMDYNNSIEDNLKFDNINEIDNQPEFIFYNIDYNNSYNNANMKEFNLIYVAKSDGIENIFGKKFVEENKDNIELIINGEKHILVDKYKLINGNNTIKIIIKNKITNLSYMFHECNTLQNIDGLKDLDTKDVENFSYMFFGCSSLLNIQSLQNWNISNGTNFSYMFFGCTSLKDLSPLENWNISNEKNIEYMFCGCSLIKDMGPIKKWKNNKLDDMFSLISL